MTTSACSSADLALDRYAHRITAHLDEAAAALPYEVVERLRASRVQALAKRKKSVVVVQQHTSVLSRLGSTLAMGGGPSGAGNSLWYTLMSGIPVLALVAGIVLIGASQDETGATEIAEVDAALLTDDLPPAAYADPGFVQFLKTRATETN